MQLAAARIVKIALVVLVTSITGGCGSHKDTNPAKPMVPTKRVIAFQGGVEETTGGPRREVFTIETDGSNLKQVSNTTSGQWIQTMDVSPTAAKIAYGLWRGGVWVINADGSDPFVVSDLDDVFGVQWSPDGSKILFREWEDGHLALAAADGSGDRVFGTLSATWDLTSWSPDGDKFAVGNDGTLAVFDLTDDSLDSLWVCNTERRLTEVAWSPIDDKILFAQENFADGNALITSISGNSSVLDTLVVVTGLNPRVYCLAWAPLGDQFLFVSHADDIDGLYVANSNGSNMKLLSSGDLASSARWSPDGSQILFILNQVEHELYLINADGSSPRRIAHNPLAVSDPGWIFKP